MSDQSKGQDEEEEGTFRWELQEMSEENVQILLNKIKRGIKDKLGAISYSILEDLYFDISSPAEEISPMAVGNFHIFDLRENRMSAETGGWRPYKQYIIHNTEVPPILTDHFVEGFEAGIGYPSGVFNILSDEETAYGIAKELINLGLTDGIAKWLYNISPQDFSIVNLEDRQIATHYQDLTDVQKDQVGLSLYFQKMGGSNSPEWQIYDHLPTFIIASGIRKMADANLLSLESFKNIPVFNESIDYLTQYTYQGVNLLDFVYDKMYVPLIEKQSVRIDPDELASLLEDNTFKDLIINYNGPLANKSQYTI